MNARPENSRIFSSFAIIDPNQFNFHRQAFPGADFQIMTANYTTLNKEKLGNELCAVCNNEMLNNISTSKACVDILHANAHPF
jgi:hypothetical protein